MGSNPLLMMMWHATVTLMCQWDLHVSHIEKIKKRGERERGEKNVFNFQKINEKREEKNMFLIFLYMTDIWLVLTHRCHHGMLHQHMERVGAHLDIYDT